ncbi:MAG TPA: FdtA/QdtA family cupin domain-containing protein [Ideonella sp.]|nr:FdtA/QdtA family cupin domain-containing protein [Ideonella sp.]
MAHVDDCRLIELRTVYDQRGSISFVESGVDVPFEFLRAYWTYDVPSRATRAGHAHKSLRQLYVAMSGSFDVHLDDGANQRVVRLAHPNEALLMGPGIWREIHNFSSNACLMVLASTHYNEADYLRTHEEFMAWVAAQATPAG